MKLGRKRRRAREHPKTSKLGNAFVVNRGVHYETPEPAEREKISAGVSHGVHQLGSDTEPAATPQPESKTGESEPDYAKEEQEEVEAAKSLFKPYATVLGVNIGLMLGAVPAAALGVSGAVITGVIVLPAPALVAPTVKGVYHGVKESCFYTKKMSPPATQPEVVEKT